MASTKSSLAILAIAGTHLIASTAAMVTAIQDVLYNGTVTAEAVSGTGSLDGHKLTPAANGTSYEWWYFDAVSTSSHYESVDIVFYDVGPDGFIGGYNDGPLSASVSGSFANGTTFDIEASAKGGATIVDDTAGIFGNWSGSGFSFRGSSLSAADIEYVIEISNEDLGVSGTVTLCSRAPPRLPCTPNGPGLSEQAFPTVFWTSAQPDASATVDLTISGTPLHFTGVGYHDKNWGVSPFVAAVAQSYWGHAHVGPYSVVWGDDLANVAGHANPQEYTALYLARDGKLVSVSCGAATVRPWGANSTYPPTYATGPPQGFEVTFQLDATEGGTFNLNVTTDLMVVDAGVYQRFIGTARGGFDGSREQYEGRALYEQFKFIGFPGT